MLGNGSIPVPQRATFQCPECKDTVFVPVAAIRFVYDRLAPDKLAPVPAPLFKCAGCEGYLTKDKAGAWIIVHKGAPVEGDEWKAV